MQKSCMPQFSHPETGNVISQFSTGSNIPLLFVSDATPRLLTVNMVNFFPCFTVQFVLIYG